jgi:hypothetical protein
MGLAANDLLLVILIIIAGPPFPVVIPIVFLAPRSRPPGWAFLHTLRFFSWLRGFLRRGSGENLLAAGTANPLPQHAFLELQRLLAARTRDGDGHGSEVIRW